MKRYETIIEDLYEAFLNASKKEYPNCTEYMFNYNETNYMVVTGKSSMLNIIKFGTVNSSTNYFNNSDSINIRITELENQEAIVKRIFEYYVKYVIADIAIKNEVVDNITEIYEET